MINRGWIKKIYFYYNEETRRMNVRRIRIHLDPETNKIKRDKLTEGKKMLALMYEYKRYYISKQNQVLFFTSCFSLLLNFLNLDTSFHLTNLIK